MTRWKYAILDTMNDGLAEDELNGYGEDGWELFDWKYVKTDRNYYSHDKMIFIFRKKLVKLIRKKKYYNPKIYTDWDDFVEDVIMSKTHVPGKYA